MTQLQNGELIEACLFMLDKEPRPHPSFNAPAISINEIAKNLLVPESAVSSCQIASAIAPLAETLFPSPRVPTPKTLNGERWLVFESPSVGAVNPLVTKRQHKRNTLLNRPPSVQTTNTPVPKSKAEQRVGGVRPLQLAPTTRSVKPPLPSAPLRQSSSGELVRDLELPSPDQQDQQPESAGRGKRSFLRPFLLKGKNKLGPNRPNELEKLDKFDKKDAAISLPSQSRTGQRRDQKQSGQEQEVLFETSTPNDIDEWTHIPRPSSKEPIFEPRAVSRPIANHGDTVANILEGYIDEDLATESAYEETAYISGSIPKETDRGQPPRDSGLPVQIPFEQLVNDPVELVEPEPIHEKGKTHPTKDNQTVGSMTTVTPGDASSTLPITVNSSAPVFAHKASWDREQPLINETQVDTSFLLLQSTVTPTHEAGSVEEPPHRTTPSSTLVEIGAEVEGEGEEDPLSPLSPLTPIVSPIFAVPPSPLTPTSSSSTPQSASSHVNPSDSDTDSGTKMKRPSRSDTSTDSGQTEGHIHRSGDEKGEEGEMPERRGRDREREEKGKSRSDDGHWERDQDRDQGRDGKKGKGRKSSRKVQDEQQQWLEVVFDGLPFGPNGTTMRVLESVKSDWRIFLAEIIALLGLAYVVQASGL